MPSNVHIFTCDFDSDPNRNHYLRDSCARFGYTLGGYGFGTPWPGYSEGKIVRAIPYLESRHEEFVLFADGSDTVLVRDPKDLLAEADNRTVLISAEKDCFPLQHLAPKFHQSDSGYNYPNAGGYVGRREIVLLVLKVLAKFYGHGEDQARWIEYISEETPHPIVRIDNWCKVFQTMSGGASGDVNLVDGRWTNVRTGTCPYLIHFNGRSAGIEEVAKTCQPTT